jgi:hypothetical protein
LELGDLSAMDEYVQPDFSTSGDRYKHVGALSGGLRPALSRIYASTCSEAI